MLLAGAEQVYDVLAAGVQKLRDQPPVATPPERLRAHQARPRLRKRGRERALPIFRAHTSGVAAERCDTKAPEAVLTGLTGEPSAELDRMSVADRFLLESCGESRLIELGVVSRAWKAPNVDDCAHAGLTECRHELVRGPRAVPERPDGHRRRPTTNRRGARVSERSWSRHRIGLATRRDGSYADRK
jgi:hypothetical protein